MSSIPTRRRLEYAKGYLALGLVREADDELGAIKPADRDSIDVRRVYVDLCMESKAWARVVEFAQPICEAKPEDEGAWIAWAYALRELQNIPEAQAVLLEAEPLHGAKCAVLHYNLACYACLLNDKKEARRRLAIACKQDKQWKAIALEDADLKAMWGEIAKMK